ncbi:hypothetical protein FGB62_28g235 [Gracilaria domingensis]|nr:hypothetical protein FGB62_28g235 [Gracilaria domingensis]
MGGEHRRRLKRSCDAPQHAHCIGAGPSSRCDTAPGDAVARARVTQARRCAGGAVAAPALAWRAPVAAARANWRARVVMRAAQLFCRAREIIAPRVRVERASRRCVAARAPSSSPRPRHDAPLRRVRGGAAAARFPRCASGVRIARGARAPAARRDAPRRRAPRLHVHQRRRRRRARREQGAAVRNPRLLAGKRVPGAGRGGDALVVLVVHRLVRHGVRHVAGLCVRRAHPAGGLRAQVRRAAAGGGAELGGGGGGARGARHAGAEEDLPGHHAPPLRRRGAPGAGAVQPGAGAARRAVPGAAPRGGGGGRRRRVHAAAGVLLGGDAVRGLGVAHRALRALLRAQRARRRAQGGRAAAAGGAVAQQRARRVARL